MFTPSKRSATSSTYNSHSRVPLIGLFADGVWHCNCSPRLPASHFQVKKEGPNTNKWFYTCQEPKESSCGFFLWDDAAKGREKGAVMANSRSEIDESRTHGRTGTGDGRTVEGHKEASNKWMADLRKKDEDNFGLLKEEEKRMTTMNQPETPRKSVKTNGFATPGAGSKRKWDALPTPATTEEIYFTPASRIMGGMWDGNERFRPSPTPTPAQFRDVAASPGPDSVLNNYDISEDVMDLLKDQEIDTETVENLKQLLSRHALRISGIVKGRNITRVALKAKDTKIAELQQRISALETEREMDKTIIRQLKGQGDS